jgi:hypothetical protein
MSWGLLMFTVQDRVEVTLNQSHGINRYRFAREPQLLAAWARATHVVGGSQVEAPPSTPEVPAPQTGPVNR